jgi:photosystem II stability/assembly factor-like uncharacterized protein
MKKNLIRLAVGVVFTVIFVHTIGAQWVQICEPVGPITAIAVNNGNLYAGTDNGVYVTSNNGTTWTAVNGGLPEYRPIRSFALMGDTLFAGCGEGIYIYSSGLFWTAVNTGLTNVSVTSLAVSGSTIFAGTRSVSYGGPIGGVLRSTNSGKSWSKLTFVHNTNSLSVNSTTIAAGTYSGVYLSTNNGNSWTDAGLTNLSVQSIALIEGTIIAGTETGIYRSTNNGKNWYSIDPLVSDGMKMSIFSLAVKGRTIIAGTEKGIYLSADNGTTWTAVNSGLPKTHIYSLAVSGNNIFAGNSIGTVFLSADNGTSWIRLNAGLANMAVFRFAKTDSALFAGSYYGIFRSTDNGKNWGVLNISPTDVNIRCMAASGKKILAGFQNDGVYFSQNNGNSWTAINSGLKGVWGNSCAQISSMEVIGDNIFAGTEDAGLFRSTDYGVNWSAIDSGLPKNISVHSLAKSGSTLFAGTELGLFSSKDLGARWTEINPGGKDPRVRCLTANAGKVIAWIESRTSNERSLVLSTDAGSKWTKINSGFPSTRINSLEYYGSNIFAVTNNGILLSTNNGVSWTVVNTDQFKNSVIFSLAIFDNTLFVGTDGGVWHRPLSDVVGVVGNPDTKSLQTIDFALRLIDAASSCAQIEFSVPRSEKVTLSVYDLVGHKIASLVNSNCAAGLHRVTWNTRNVASGFYMIRMQAGVNRDIKGVSIVR